MPHLVLELEVDSLYSDFSVVVHLELEDVVVVVASSALASDSALVACFADRLCFFAS